MPEEGATPRALILTNLSARGTGFKTRARQSADGTIRIRNRGIGQMSVLFILTGFVCFGIGLYAEVTRQKGEASLLGAMGGLGAASWLVALNYYFLYDSFAINPATSTARWTCRRGPFKQTEIGTSGDIELHIGRRMSPNGQKLNATGYGVVFIFIPTGHALLASAVRTEEQARAYIAALPRPLQQLTGNGNVELWLDMEHSPAIYPRGRWPREESESSDRHDSALMQRAGAAGLTQRADAVW